MVQLWCVVQLKNPTLLPLNGNESLGSRCPKRSTEMLLSCISAFWFLQLAHGRLDDEGDGNPSVHREIGPE